MNLKGRHFLTLKDYTQEEILYLIDLAADLKAKKIGRKVLDWNWGQAWLSGHSTVLQEL
jgi:ornithine carbamoyltransferase